MKKVFLTTLLLGSFSAFATDVPATFYFPYFKRVYQDCTAGSSCTRELVRSFSDKFDETSPDRLQLVQESVPLLLTKFKAVEKDYIDAFEHPKIHPKSKKILSDVLGTGWWQLGSRLKETFLSLNKAQEKFLELNEKASDATDILLQAVIEIEDKPSGIEDDEVRRLYVAQKKIEIRQLTKNLWDRLDALTMYAFHLFVEQYAVVKFYSPKSLIILQLMDKSCLRDTNQDPSRYDSYLLSLPLDGRTDHRKVLRMIVGNGTQAPAKVVCKKVRDLPAKITFNPSSRVLTIPYTKKWAWWYETWDFELPPMEEIFPVIPE
jgi:hypothetical protein